MKMWEYCVVHRTAYTVFFLTPKGERASEVRKDKSKGDKHDADATVRLIADLGIDGWELVSVDNGIWYFKRPIEQS